MLSAAALITIGLSGCYPKMAVAETINQETTEKSMNEGSQERIMKSENVNVNLYKGLVDKSENWMFSPYSLKDAFSLLYHGTNGEVRDEFMNVLGLNENVANGIREYDRKTASDNFKIANKVYINNLMRDDLNTDVLQLDNRLYDGLDVLKPEAEADRINQFVSNATNNKITDLVASSAITPDSAMLLINALYFNQPWDFDEKTVVWNEDGKNYKAFGSDDYPIENVKEVDNKSIDVLKLYYEDVTFFDNGVEKPKFAMTILAPSIDSETNNVDGYMEALTDAELNELLNFNDYKGLSDYTNVDFTVPDFEFENKFSLKDPLKKLGMKEAFNAETEGFKDLGDVYVSDVIQAAYVKCNDKGTEAAAATQIGMVSRSALVIPEEKTKHVIVDDTFVFIISDLETDDILFMGRVIQPSEKK